MGGNLKLVRQECRGDYMALVKPVISIGHQQASTYEVLGPLLLEP